MSIDEEIADVNMKLRDPAISYHDKSELINKSIRLNRQKSKEMI